MASGSRKKITYAHKRNRSKPSRVISASSPPQEIRDPDHSMSQSELPRGLLKRRSSNPEAFSSKKLKTAGITPSGSPKHYDTPHPSALIEEQIFMLNSSRGLPVDPDQFSPLPVARRIISRTASSNLKENASLRALKKSKFCESPFNSRPNSAASSPQKAQLVRALPNSTEQSTQKPFKRTLSDTNYNPNLPQSVSATNSPPHHSPARIRRPSAPSPSRPVTWFPKEITIGSFDFNLHTTYGNPFSLPSNNIDFDRPPSSLSFYDSDAQFFNEAQGISTPATKKRAYTLGSAIAGDDDELYEPDLTITHAMDVDFASSSGMKPMPMRERSPWLSDSLISPPASQEWNRAPLEGGYTRSPPQDGGMYDVPLDLGVVSEPPVFVPGGEETVETAPHAEEHNVGARDLKSMFDGLGLATKNRFLNSRTRSLDSPVASVSADDQIQKKPKGRDHRGTIRASYFPKTKTVTARRTRSGTVVGPQAPIQRAHSLNGPEIRGIGEENEDQDELNGFRADGCAPPSPVILRQRPGMTVILADSDLPDELDVLATGSGPMHSPVLQLKKKGGSKGKARAVVMEDDESDDELLLKPGFNVWE
ncbi:hypothetical protein C8R44DRAFT_889844 [Mycena epipterygia]|nr:hypothetical protein C8R44DRAFT_889844 [Mycena epipterygia]